MQSRNLLRYSPLGQFALTSTLGRGVLLLKQCQGETNASEFQNQQQQQQFCSMPQQIDQNNNGTYKEYLNQIYQIRHDFLDIRPNNYKKIKDLYVIACNYTLPRSTLPIWDTAMFRLCADGGANQIYESIPNLIFENEKFENQKQLLSRYRPDMIKGDLDSVRTEVRSFYENLGVEIVDRSSDQDTTDLEKCIKCLQKKFDREGIHDYRSVQIAVLGGIGGRLDHILSNLHLLYSYQHLSIALFGTETVCRLLHPGRSIIRPILGVEGPACGLIPLKGIATVSTSGLKWDMQNSLLEFGTFISTSNEVASDVIVVDTDNPLIWSVEVDEDNYIKRFQS